MEEYSGLDDETVIDLAKEKEAILLTEDSYFGEWVFAYGIKSICLNLLQTKKYNFKNTFFVLTSKKMRIRNI